MTDPRTPGPPETSPPGEGAALRRGSPLAPQGRRTWSAANAAWTVAALAVPVGATYASRYLSHWPHAWWSNDSLALSCGIVAGILVGVASRRLIGWILAPYLGAAAGLLAYGALERVAALPFISPRALVLLPSWGLLIGYVVGLFLPTGRDAAWALAAAAGAEAAGRWVASLGMFGWVAGVDDGYWLDHAVPFSLASCAAVACVRSAGPQASTHPLHLRRWLLLGLAFALAAWGADAYQRRLRFRNYVLPGAEARRLCWDLRHGWSGQLVAALVAAERRFAAGGISTRRIKQGSYCLLCLAEPADGRRRHVGFILDWSTDDDDSPVDAVVIDRLEVRDSVPSVLGLSLPEGSASILMIDMSLARRPLWRAMDIDLDYDTVGRALDEGRRWAIDGGLRDRRNVATAEWVDGLCARFLARLRDESR